MSGTYPNGLSGPDPILNTLDSATGLSWSSPPAQPTFLRNGYHAEISLVEAPRMVRRLQQAATQATGRPRAIVFQALGRGVAIINVPKEVAQGRWFLEALTQPDSQAGIGKARIPAAIAARSLQRQATPLS